MNHYWRAAIRLRITLWRINAALWLGAGVRRLALLAFVFGFRNAADRLIAFDARLIERGRRMLIAEYVAAGEPIPAKLRPTT